MRGARAGVREARTGAREGRQADGACDGGRRDGGPCAYLFQHPVCPPEAGGRAQLSLLRQGGGQLFPARNGKPHGGVACRGVGHALRARLPADRGAEQQKYSKVCARGIRGHAAYTGPSAGMDGGKIPPVQQGPGGAQHAFPARHGRGACGAQAAALRRTSGASGPRCRLPLRVHSAAPCRR